MPPTRLGQQGYRRFDGTGQQVSRSQGATGGSPQVTWVRGPWPGFEPDLDPAQATPGAAESVSNLIDVGGALRHQDGFARVDSARLPLGDTTPPAVAADAEPIVAIFEGRTNATQATRKYALTADDSADAGGYFGHLYELVTGAWTHRAATVPADSYRGTATDPGATLADTAHFAAGDYTVFVGGPGGNFLHRFPGVSVATEYERVANLGAVTSLGAQSVVSSEERILVLNTNENGTVFPARLRWTSKGANARFDPTITGAGFGDFNDFGSEGLAVRNIGPKIALYFVNGVQFIRRTGIATDPFTKDYSTVGRGLLGTHAIAEVGYGTHFGIFTDGWFFLDYNGAWREAGIKQGGYPKWFAEFYNGLGWRNRKRVTIEYEPVNKLIYVGWPQEETGLPGPSVVWLYDMKTDTVWPAPDWPQQPNIIKAVTEEVSTGLTYATVTTQTYENTFDAYEAFGPRVGLRRIAHGTNDGLVMQHSHLLASRDTIYPTYNYGMKLFGGDRTERVKRLDKVNVSYTRQAGATPISVTITGGTSGKQATGTIDHTKGTIGAKQIDFASGVVSDHQHSVAIGGVVPVAVDGIGIQIYTPAVNARKEGSV